MIIPFKIRYKSYPYAPKAKGASMRLGFLFSWPVLVFLSFIWIGIFGFLLDSLGLFPNLASSCIAVISLLPVGFALFKWKKKKEAKIEQAAIRETKFMLSMSPEEKRKYDEKHLKDGRRILALLFGGMLLGLLILLVLLDVF